MIAVAVLVAGLCSGCVIGFVAGYLHFVPKAFAEGVARADLEWGNFLENHIVGPTQTKHPRRGNG